MIMTARCKPQRAFRQNRPRRGAVAVLSAVLLVVLLITSAISINIAYIQHTRAELRAANDAATRAAGEALARTGEEKEARKAAKAAALRNTVAGVPFIVEDADVVLGNSFEDEKTGDWVFAPGVKPYNSVRVNGGRTASSKSGEVTLFVGALLGNASFGAESHAAVINRFRDRDFALVVDRSGSMTRPAGSGMSKWEALLASTAAFFDALKQTNDKEQVGIASYSTASTLDQTLKEKYDDSQKILKGLPVSGWTNIHAGITDGTAILNGSDYRAGAKKVMVLMTDGIHNTGPDPMQAAQDAALSEIEIYTITFGAGTDVDIPQMQAIAAATGGLHYHAPDAATLKQVFLQVVQDSAGIHFIQ